MKSYLKIIALALASVTIASAFTACSADYDLINQTETHLGTNGSSDTQSKNTTGSGKNTDKSTTNQSTSEGATDDIGGGTNQSTDKATEKATSATTDKTAETIPSNAYMLFQSGKYTVKAIMPDRPTDVENAVYAKLRSTVKSKTGMTLQTNTDYLSPGATHSTSEPEILVGLTNYTESINAYTDITNGTYGIKISGKKIIFYFSTVAEGLELVESFASAMTSTKDKTAFWVSNTLSVSKKLSFKLETVPSYPTATTKYNCYDDTTMLIANSTNLTNYNNYCSTLKSNGFTEYSKRDNVNGNYFRTYTKGTMALTVYFNKSNSTVRIISGPLTDIPAKDTSYAKETNTKPSVTLLNQGKKQDGTTDQASGLGMIYYLPNGKFIIYDGGYTANDGLYKKLKELAGSNDIIIAAWIISHPHHDHQDAFDAFLKNYASKIRIENVMYNFTDLKDSYGDSATIRDTVKKYLDGKTNVIKPHTGQIYTFGSSSVEIMYTVEDFIPKTVDDLNNTSMVVRVTVSGKSTMLLGDALSKAAEWLTSTYGSYLKSDMVQLAHHGTTPGTEALYSNINAPILFWPSATANVKDKYNKADHASLRKAIAVASDVYLASDGSKTLTIPCTIVNNKAAFLSRMGF